VVKPRTYGELLALEDVMVAKGWPSKLGIEKRPFAKGLYGAYFYNRGLEAGRSRLAEVEQLIWTTMGISTGPAIYLKRGCTEMEIDQGRSDQWKHYGFHDDIEMILDRMLYIPEQPEQTEAEKAKVRQKWQHFAWKHDPTYKGPGPVKDCVRY